MNHGDEQGVAADIVQPVEKGAAGSKPEAPPCEGHPDAVRLMDEAFRRAETALGTNGLPFARKADRTPSESNGRPGAHSSASGCS